MSSLVIKLLKSTSENSETAHVRRKSTKRITSPVDSDDDPTVDSAPPPKRPRIERSPDISDDNEALTSPTEAPRSSARAAPASNSRLKPKPPTKKRSKVVVSDPESEEFDPDDDESEPEPPIDNDDEYLSEPKNPTKRTGGGKGKGAKGKKKAEPTKEIMAKDERKRPMDVSDAAPAAKRPRTKPSNKSGGEVTVDVVGDDPTLNTPPPKEEAPPGPKKPRLPPIKKNKASTAASAGASGAAGTSISSIPAKPTALAAARVEEDSKLPAPIVGGRKPTIVPASVDVDLTNPTMYAQLFKSAGGRTPSGFSHREKDEERRKELNRMRDEARAKRINEAAPAFDLQGQMDKIIRFEERLKTTRSPAYYPNFLAGGLKSLQQGKKCYTGTELEPEAREEGEM
ncbi:hypothetical protein DFH07DRAFT_104793 [Mycena maculata]|uniref:Uncharacterized protein n=1 Tax=Mycena maculata TaxID=230809 RepID=A0AAD7NTF8_9AGAR|nr:hypothetical protein DFH07DRAFT_104793 [Mycena maculata]